MVKSNFPKKKKIIKIFRVWGRSMASLLLVLIKLYDGINGVSIFTTIVKSMKKNQDKLNFIIYLYIIFIIDEIFRSPLFFLNMNFNNYFRYHRYLL